MKQAVYWLLIVVLWVADAFAQGEISPYKFTNQERSQGLKSYIAPSSSRFSLKRAGQGASDLTFYMTKPEKDKFPLVFVCDGSSAPGDITSVIHLHRYFLQEFLDRGVGVVTVEKWGVTDRHVNTREFIKNYTRTQRLEDHITVIEHMIHHPPQGWNGKMIFLGISEGGALATSLTIKYAKRTLATMNWSGAGGWNWRDELWVFLVEEMKTMTIPWYIKLRNLLPTWCSFYESLDPMTRKEYDAVMDKIRTDPTDKKEFLGMTYQYHADCMSWAPVGYQHIKTPYLVIAGAKDSAIGTSDAFVEQARQHHVDITYFRVPDMDHFIINRPDVINQAFAWLKPKLMEN